MKVNSKKKKQPSKKRNIKPGHGCNLEVLVELDRSPEIDKLVKPEPKSTVNAEGNAGFSSQPRIKLEPNHDESQVIKEEMTDGEPCPLGAVSPKLEPGSEEPNGWTVRIKSEPESEFEITQPEQEDVEPRVKQEDEGDQDVKQEGAEDDDDTSTSGRRLDLSSFLPLGTVKCLFQMLFCFLISPCLLVYIP